MAYAVKMAKYFIAGFFITRLLIIGSEDGQLCIPVQTLEFGERGNITCSFQEDYFGVYWYDTQDLTQQPVLYKENGILGGDGYESGKFDLAQDGSLLIRNVTSEYERVFTVVILETRLTENLRHETIEVKVFAHPSVPYPVIDQCMNQQYCYSKLRDAGILKCTVENARPPVNLTWIEKRSGGDTDITSNQTHVIKYGLATSTAAMTYGKSVPPFFGVFVCKVQHNALILMNPASFTVVELGQPNYSLAGVNVKEIKAGSSVLLQCNKGNMIYFVWKKAVSQSENQFDVIAHGYTTVGMKFSENPYEVDSNGLLEILRFTKEEDGLYVCYSGNGFREHAESYLITTGFGSTTSSAATVADNLTASKERKLLDAIVICIGIIFPFAGLVLLWIVSKHEKSVSNKDVRRDTMDEIQERDDHEMPLMSQKVNAEDVRRDSVDEIQAQDDPAMPLTLQNFSVSDKVPSERLVSDGENNDTSIVNDVSRDAMDEIHAQVDPGMPLMSQPLSMSDKESLVSDEENNDTSNVNVPAEGLVSNGQNNDTSNVNDHQNDGEELLETYCRFAGSSVVGTSYKTNIRKYEIGKMVSKRNGKMILVLRDNESGKAETIEDLCFHLSDVKKDGTIKVGLAKDDHFLTGHQNSNCINWISVYSTCKSIDYDITVIDIPISYCSSGPEELHLGKITECLYCLMTNDTAYALHQINAIVLLITHGCGAFQLRRLFSKDIRDCIYDKDGDFSRFLSFLTNCSPIKKDQSILVLKERLKLEKIMKIVKDHNDIKEIRIAKESLKSMKDGYELPKKVDILGKEMAMVCDICKTTCHFPCNHSWNFFCESMHWFSLLRGCKVCPNRCSPDIHKRCNYRYKTYEEKDEEEKAQASKVSSTVERAKKMMQLEEVHNCLKVLSDNALEETLLSIEVERDKLIIKEKSNGEAGGQTFLKIIQRVFE